MLTEGLKAELQRIQLANPANEAEVETKILLHVFRLLGYTDVDRADKPAIPMAFGRERRTKHPDFVLYAGAERSVEAALVAVETKAGDSSLSEAEDQARSYSLWAGTPFYLVCNAERLRAVQFLPGAQGFRVVEIGLRDIVSQWDTLAAFISRTEAILAKERLEYLTEYLPQVEHLPPREFFQEYLFRLHDRFSAVVAQPATALQPPDSSQTALPRIPVTVQLSGPEAREYDETEIAAVLAESGTKLLITGAPGSGKSTMSKRVISSLTDTTLDIPGDILPVYVRLALAVPESIMEAFTQGCREMGLRVLPNLFQRQLRLARPILVLDGLDEAEPSDLTRAKLARLVREAQHSLLLTTRPIALLDFERSLPLEEFTSGEVRPLSTAELRAVLTEYLQDEQLVEKVLSSTPLELRQDLRSPLFALMAIRVAQSNPNWIDLGRYELFETYVNILDRFFNATTVRGADGLYQGSALLALSRTAALMSRRAEGYAYSLEELQAEAEEKGSGQDFRALLNTGLITAPGGRVSFIHRSFYDFGLAHHMLGSIKERASEAFVQIYPSATANEFLRPQLSDEDENTLVEWLKEPDNRLRRRVLGIFRYGASPTTLAAIRSLLDEDLSNRLYGITVKVLATNGDPEFPTIALANQRTGKAGRSRFRALANALGARDEYYPTLKQIAEERRSVSATAAFISLALRSSRPESPHDIISAIFRFSNGERAELARVLDRNRDTPLARQVVRTALTSEEDPDVTLLLLHVARDFLLEIGDETFFAAIERLRMIRRPTPHQKKVSRALVRVVRGLKRRGRPPLSLLAQELHRLVHTGR